MSMLHSNGSARVLADLAVTVTGAAGAIGGAITSLMAAGGARVLAIDVNGPAIRRLTADIVAAGGSVEALEADMSREEEVRLAARHIETSLGHLDIVINCAGILRLGSLIETELDAWQRVFRTNVESAFLVTRECLKIMLAQPVHPRMGCRGKIINLSSGAAELGRPFLPAYGASKAALNHLSMSTASGYGRELICTTVVYPGNVEEGMWRDLAPQLARVEGRREDDVLRERWFQSPAQVAEMVLYVAVSEGMDLNGQVVHSYPWVAPLHRAENGVRWRAMRPAE